MSYWQNVNGIKNQPANVSVDEHLRRNTQTAKSSQYSKYTDYSAVFFLSYMPSLLFEAAVIDCL